MSTLKNFLIKIINEELDRVLSGKSKNMSINDIANKHNVSVKKIEQQLEKGVKIEMEHTKDKKIALKIAKDHLVEFPDYYTRLIKMEKDAEK